MNFIKNAKLYINTSFLIPSNRLYTTLAMPVGFIRLQQKQKKSWAGPYLYMYVTNFIDDRVLRKKNFSFRTGISRDIL